MRALAEMAAKERRRIVGLMSGTSADAVDAVLAEIEGAGEQTRAEVRSFCSVEMPAGLRRQLLALFAGEAGLDDLCQANFAVGAFFAEAALAAIEAAGLRPAEVDLIGSHGQTVRHLPRGRPPSTLQIGEAAVIAQRTGIATIADFRPADMAAGGEGAPLVPLADHLLFAHPQKGRILLNIGGMANVTALPAGADLGAVRAFDTGPGNALMDAAVEHFSGGRERFDRGGARAARGPVNGEWLGRLMRHPYIRRRPPKSTGREEFGRPFLEHILAATAWEESELLATLAEFSARAIAHAIHTYVEGRFEEVWVAGGGVHNAHLLERLRALLAEWHVASLAELGVDPDAREALAFAVLANETLMGRAGNVPAATGARRRVVLGKMAMP